MPIERGDRELRLGFAMGGGVSLGTFAGAALAEAIVLAIAHGQYIAEDGRPRRYKRVVVDAFSGAGAMALAAMLRSLANPKTAVGSELWQPALDAASQRFAGLLAELDPAEREIVRSQLAGATVVDLAQRRAWVEEIGIGPLLGRTGAGWNDLTWEAGLLDRDAVESIAGGLLEPGDFALEPEATRLLGDRVLLVCSLSSISPLLADARDRFLVSTADGVRRAALREGLTSSLHKDTRVFDLILDQAKCDRVEAMDACSAAFQDEFPARWVRYRMGDEQPGRVGDLRTRRAWAKMGATAIACGAFPGAFAPVALTRRRHEFGPHWPEALAEHDDDPTYQHSFTYIDGGLFNNEPVREAFRLASFLDSWNPWADYDRRVVFVDPNVAPAGRTMEVPVHRQFGEFGGHGLGRRGPNRLATLRRLLPHAGSVVQAVLAEGRAREGDKAAGIRDEFKVRDEFRKALVGEALPADDAWLAFLVEFCVSRLREIKEGKEIPPGALTVDRELERVAAELAGALPEGDREPFAALEGRAAQFVADRQPPAGTERPAWGAALLAVAVDALLDLAGKDVQGQLVAIAPIRRRGANYEIIELPGGTLQGFSGFMSRINREYEVDVARHCALQFLRWGGLLPEGRLPDATEDEPRWDADNAEAFRGDVERGIGQLMERLRDALADSKFIDVPLVGGAIRDFLMNKIEEALKRGIEAPAPERRYTLHVRIPVGMDKLSLDGSSSNTADLEPTALREGESPVLVTTLTRRLRGGRWRAVGPHVVDGRELRLEREGIGGILSSRADRLLARIPLPDEARLANADLMSDPVFTCSVARANGRWKVSEWQLREAPEDDLQSSLERRWEG